jgi:hypothetical protein
MAGLVWPPLVAALAVADDRCRTPEENRDA